MDFPRGIAQILGQNLHHKYLGWECVREGIIKGARVALFVHHSSLLASIHLSIHACMHACVQALLFNRQHSEPFIDDPQQCALRVCVTEPKVDLSLGGGEEKHP